MARILTPVEFTIFLIRKNLKKSFLYLELKSHLTPWIMDLLKKLIIADIIVNFPWNPEFHYCGHRSLPVVPVLSQLNLI
jgi:hypothetical protein